jgi:hypothetical protein
MLSTGGGVRRNAGEAALDDVLGARGTDLKAVRFDLAREVEGLLNDFLARGYGLVQ